MYAIRSYYAGVGRSPPTALFSRISTGKKNCWLPHSFHELEKSATSSKVDRVEIV